MIKLSSLKRHDSVTRVVSFELLTKDENNNEIKTPFTLEYYSPTLKGFLHAKEIAGGNLPKIISDANASMQEFCVSFLAHYIVGLPDLTDDEGNEVKPSEELFASLEWDLIRQFYLGLLGAIDPKQKAVMLRRLSGQTDDEETSTAT